MPFENITDHITFPPIVLYWQAFHIDIYGRTYVDAILNSLKKIAILWENSVSIRDRISLHRTFHNEFTNESRSMEISIYM